MAHFAKIGVGNIIERVEVVSNDIALTEQAGVDFLNNLYNTRDFWVQTSYNRNIRKNFAGIGYTYDQTRDAFIGPKPYNSWVLNENTYLWEAPTSYPNTFTKSLTNSEGDTIPDKYYWHEQTQTWILI